MRAFLPAVILSLATMLMWLGGAAGPVAAGTPAEFAVYAPLVAEGQGPGAMQSPYPAQGPYAAQGQCAGPGQYGEQGQEAQSPFYSLDELLNPCDCGPRWIFSGDVVVLQRSAPRSQRLFVNRTGSFDTDPINAKNVYFPVEFGPKVSAVRRGPDGWELEVAYFQMDGFAAQAIVPGQSVLVTDVNSGFAVIDPQYRYTSALYSGELNLRRQWTEWLNLLAGFRMGQLNEHYRAGGMGGGTAPVPVSLNVDTFNYMYGLQLGADAEIYNMGGPLLVNVFCKGGGFTNRASQNNRRIQTGLSDESLGAQHDQLAFLGETGAVVSYAVTRNIAVRASIEAAWLEGVALAPEQIAETNFNTSTARVDTHGGVFYYGGGLGIECRY
jgi:hypothetical protein